MADKTNSDSLASLEKRDSVSALKHEQEDCLLSSGMVSISAPREPEEGVTKIGDSISKADIGFDEKGLLRRSVQSGNGRRLEIRVVDETALVGSVFSFLKAKTECETVEKKKKKKTTKMTYSRETMESVQFLNMKKQRKMWKDVHVGLGPTVRKEYDFLLTSTASHLQPKNSFLFHNIPSASLSLSGPFAPRGRLNQVNVSAN